MPQVTVCLGCVEGVTVKVHRCAGAAELLPYGGWCECPQPGCGPRGDRQRRPSTADSTVPA